MKTVLYVEDDASCRYLISTILSRAGYKVLCASTTADGLRLAQSESPDLMLVDLHLPTGNGIDLMAQLRLLPALANTPIAAITADIERYHPHDLLDEGFDAVLTKPFAHADLLQRVSTLMVGTAAQR